jgi:hypothetical protein
MLIGSGVIMKRIIIGVTVFLFILLLPIPSVYSKILLRPFAGAGYSQTAGSDGTGAGVHAGARLLLQANANQSYGIEVSFIDAYRIAGSAEDIKFIPVGLVLEQKLFGWFIMGIGTIGYVGIGSNKSNPFGLVTNLGWEPEWDSKWSPFITYRAEFIFDEQIRQHSSISSGITFAL